QIRSFDAWTKQGGVVSELHDRKVCPDLDSMQGRVGGERVTRERPLRRVHNDLVPFPDQIPGEAEDMGLRSAFFGSEVRHDLMDLHNRSRSGDDVVSSKSRYESRRRGSIAFQLYFVSNATRRRAPIASHSAGDSIHDSTPCPAHPRRLARSRPPRVGFWSVSVEPNAVPQLHIEEGPELPGVVPGPHHVIPDEAPNRFGAEQAA